jgi:hypothetical protein
MLKQRKGEFSGCCKQIAEFSHGHLGLFRVKGTKAGNHVIVLRGSHTASHDADQIAVFGHQLEQIGQFFVREAELFGQFGFQGGQKPVLFQQGGNPRADVVVRARKRNRKGFSRTIS